MTEFTLPSAHRGNTQHISGNTSAAHPASESSRAGEARGVGHVGHYNRVSFQGHVAACDGRVDLNLGIIGDPVATAEWDGYAFEYAHHGDAENGGQNEDSDEEEGEPLLPVRRREFDCWEDKVKAQGKINSKSNVTVASKPALPTKPTPAAAAAAAALPKAKRKQLAVQPTPSAWRRHRAHRPAVVFPSSPASFSPFIKPAAPPVLFTLSVTFLTDVYRLPITSATTLTDAIRVLGEWSGIGGEVWALLGIANQGGGVVWGVAKWEELKMAAMEEGGEEVAGVVVKRK